MAWWVNQNGAKSVEYPTKAKAQGVARQLRGASVTRKPVKTPKHTTSDGHRKRWWQR